MFEIWKSLTQSSTYARVIRICRKKSPKCRQGVSFCPLVEASLTLDYLSSLHAIPRAWASEECIILATRGTGGTRVPELRSSLKLLEISPAMLTGALVVRQTTPGVNRGGYMEDRASAEGWDGAETEAFRLPGT